MKVGVVDIGTNSMRMLITDGVSDEGRWVEVTGLGRGVDASGRLSDEAIDATIEVLSEFGRIMDEGSVQKRRAIATSASRDATNRDEFFDRVRGVLGVTPELISGEEEGGLAFLGATSDLEFTSPAVVSDIGGGSTEFVSEGMARSIDIGSVRLTDRTLRNRPPTEGEMSRSRALLAELFAEIERTDWRTLIGVGGTWTSLAAMIHEVVPYEHDEIHGSEVTAAEVSDLVSRLAELTVEETAALPGLHPKRAPVILAGAMVASAVMETVGLETTIVSERDTLDGAAAELMGIA